MRLAPEKRDLIGRAILTFYFTVCATLQIMNLRSFDGSWLHLAATIATLGFLLLVVGTTLGRLPPVRSAQGLSRQIVALVGAFATVTLVVVPPVEIPAGVRIVADSLVLIGFLLSVWCLWWLGRSFSVMAQARRLVTQGPYRYVRHPLYVCETVALVGILLRNPSAWSFTIAAVALVFQYLRILNEEKVLRDAFPEYEEYARSTPMLMPAFR